MSELYVKKINDKYEPKYRKGWQKANDQFQVIADRLFIDYEEDDEPGLTDVSSQYEWEFRQS